MRFRLRFSNQSPAHGYHRCIVRHFARSVRSDSDADRVFGNDKPSRTRSPYREMDLPSVPSARRVYRKEAIPTGIHGRKATLSTAKRLCRRLTRHLWHLYDSPGGRRVGSPSRRCAASSNPLSAEGGRFGSTPEFRSRTRLAGSPRKKRGSRGYPGVWLRQSRFATARRFYHRFLEFGV
jgi:hypothetical protein